MAGWTVTDKADGCEISWDGNLRAKKVKANQGEFSGNVGIGTSSPEDRLDILDNDTTSNQGGLRISSTSGEYLSLGLKDAGLVPQIIGQNTLSIGNVNELDAIKINSSSDVIIKKQLSITGNITAANFYPVGSIFLSVVSTNPATLLGFGTWSAFATGRYLVGIPASGTVEATTGTALSNTENRATGAHGHADTFAISPNPHSHTINVGATAAGTIPGRGVTPTQITPSTNTTSLSITGSVTSSASPNNVAGTPAPNIYVYMWKRTA